MPTFSYFPGPIISPRNRRGTSSTSATISRARGSTATQPRSSRGETTRSPRSTDKIASRSTDKTRAARWLSLRTRVRCRLCHEDFVHGTARPCPKRPVGFPHLPHQLMKDMDLNYKLPMSKEKARKLLLQVGTDTAWLCEHNIADYSFYLGVHKRSYDVDMARNASFRMSMTDISSMMEGGPRRGGVPNFFQEDDGGIGAVFVEGPAVFYIGIIDMLQEYDVMKRIERAWKTRCRGLPSDGISVMAPISYRQRFLNKVKDIIEPVGDPGTPGGGAVR
jgi:hypothetical protein